MGAAPYTTAEALRAATSRDAAAGAMQTTFPILGEEPVIDQVLRQLIAGIETLTEDRFPTRRAGTRAGARYFPFLHGQQQPPVAQERYGRSVAWGASCGDQREVFTNLSVPVMTRLRQRERVVLDTLVDAGVARSRSEALVWAVRLVGQHTEEWLTELREAMASVEEVRGRGPQ